MRLHLSTPFTDCKQVVTAALYESSLINSTADSVHMTSAFNSGAIKAENISGAVFITAVLDTSQL